MKRSHRQELGVLLGHHANYVLLKDDRKEPTGRYKKTTATKQPRALTSTIPLEGNYGISPQGSLFVLDLDTHSSKDLRRQRKFFEDFFKIDLTHGFQVETPSKGAHYYIRLPEGFREFFNGSLRPYASDILEYMGIEEFPLDADIRSAKAAGYAVGPGSYVAYDRKGERLEVPGEYRISASAKEILASGDFTQLPLADLEACEFLTSLQLARQSHRAEKTPKPLKVKKVKASSLDAELVWDSVEATTKLKDSLPTASDVKKLARVIAKTSLTLESRGQTYTYYRQRAFIVNALMCCYSNKAIFETISLLDIGRDTYTASRLRQHQVLSDIKKLRRPSSEVHHTSYCGAKPRIVSASGQKPLEVLKQEWKAKVAARKVGRQGVLRRADPRVIDMTKAIEHLTPNSKRVSQQMRDAIMLLDAFFQPLHNSGAPKVVMAQKPVAAMLSISESRTKAALRLLRTRGVVRLIDRQRTGLASTYAVAAEYTDGYRTGKLKQTWYRLKTERNLETPLYFDRFAHELREVFTGKTVHNFAQSAAPSAAFVLPESLRTMTAKLYNKDAAREAGLTIARDSDEPLVIDERTGEILDATYELERQRPVRLRYLSGRDPRRKNKIPRRVFFISKLRLLETKTFARQLDPPDSTTYVLRLRPPRRVDKTE